MRTALALKQAAVVPDRIFDKPRLAEIYDHLDSDRSDLDVYMSLGLISAVVLLRCNDDAMTFDDAEESPALGSRRRFEVGDPECEVAVVRPAMAGDAARVAEVHVQSWRIGYRGVLADEALEAATVESRLPWWTQVLDAGVEGFRVVVVENVDGVVQGFGSTCPSDEDPDHVGEIAQIYLHPSSWGSGLAGPLMDGLEADLRRRGYEVAELHVARGNPRARRFYEQRGWRDTGIEHREVIWDVESVTTTYRLDL